MTKAAAASVLMTGALTFALLDAAHADPGQYVSVGVTQTAYTQGNVCIATVTATTTPEPGAGDGAGPTIQANGSIVCTRDINRIDQSMRLYVNGSQVDSAPGFTFTQSAAANMQTTFSRNSSKRTVRYCAVVTTVSPPINKTICAETAPAI